MPHKRYYIRKSDKTTAGGVVTEGLASFTMDDKLAAFDTASVWCPVCKVEGQIAIVGPRRPFTLPNNREIAMEGDLCLCQCSRRRVCLPLRMWLGCNLRTMNWHAWAMPKMIWSARRMTNNLPCVTIIPANADSITGYVVYGENLQS